jgi:hypothetical protein
VFNLTVSTSAGTLSIPQALPGTTLGGRESKVIVTDYTYGDNGTLLYSTAGILFAGKLGARDVLFLYGSAGQGHELSINGTPIAFPDGVVGGPVPVIDTDSSLVVFSDSVTATSFWNPVLASNSSDPLQNYWAIGTTDSVLVGGPHLVRNASLSGTTLALRGDLNTSAPLVIIGSETIDSVTWNGAAVTLNASAAAAISAHGGVLVGEVTMASTQGIAVPELTGWKFAGSLPEASAAFDDSNFTLADHTTTNIEPAMLYGDGRVLFGCDYGL